MRRNFKFNLSKLSYIASKNVLNVLKNKKYCQFFVIKKKTFSLAVCRVVIRLLQPRNSTNDINMRKFYNTKKKNTYTSQNQAEVTARANIESLLSEGESLIAADKELCPPFSTRKKLHNVIFQI